MVILLGYLQILVGALNVVGSVIRYVFGKEKYIDYKKDLGRYIVLVTLYFTLWFGLEYSNVVFPDFLVIIYVVIIPWTLAIYFFNIAYIKNNHADES